MLESQEEEEDLYLERPNISKFLADKVRECQSETELLRFLLREKPQELKCGREHYLEMHKLEEYMNGLSLKLDIHGYEDRGERLKYLYTTLRSKYADKKDIFKIMVQFVMDMSIRPTAVTHLHVSSIQYSAEPDKEESSDDDSEKQKDLLKEIFAQDPPDDDIDLQYSSDSDLSAWSTDEEEESFTEKSDNNLPPLGTMRYSSSFGEFSDLPKDVIDPEVAKQEIKLHWMQERAKSEAFFRQSVRKFDVAALSNQPVISSLLVLQSRFGEFWEWKRSTEQGVLLVAFEEDVVREILWQLVVSNPDVSPVFTKSWLLKPNLILATVSKSSLSYFVNVYGSTLRKLEDLRKFANSIERSTKITQDGILPPSKIHRNYAYAVQEFSMYITTQVHLIERELRKTCRDSRDLSEPGCTTLLLLERRTGPILEMINFLYEIHAKGVLSSESEEPWLASIKLMSCLEAHLLLETKPAHYGILLYFFSRCLHALLDDIISTLKTLKWDERYSLFIRDQSVRLNDSNFWAECIKIKDYKKELHSSGITSLMCLDHLLPRLLNILKTCEVLDQLEEDFTNILSKSVLDAQDIVNQFLEESQPKPKKSKSLPQKQEPLPSPPKKENIDFMKHFEYIGLGSSYAKDAFRFLTSPQKVFPARDSKRSFKLEELVRLPKIPRKAHSDALEKVLAEMFTPFCVSAQENIQKIFQVYKVIDSMTVFQEIILAVREDFARTIIDIASNKKCSDEYKYEDSLNRNPRYQKLLNECYPDGRECFSVELKLDASSDMNCTFIVTPYFPLNLIVTPKSVAGYLFIGRQLHRIRKSVWDISSLSMKDCRGTEGVDVTRMLMFRFCLINFCSSIRSFFTLKLFSKDFSAFAKSASYEDDIDSLRKIHEDYLESIKTRMLRNPLIENIIIRKTVVMSDVLKKKWTSGIPQVTMLMLEDTLKKCWQVVNDFQSAKHSFDFNELSYHFGQPPSCLSS